MPKNLNPESIPRARSLLVGTIGVTILILLALPGLTVAYGGSAAARRSTARSSDLHENRSPVFVGNSTSRVASTPAASGTAASNDVNAGNSTAARFTVTALSATNERDGGQELRSADPPRRIRQPLQARRSAHDKLLASLRNAIRLLNQLVPPAQRLLRHSDGAVRAQQQPAGVD